MLIVAVISNEKMVRRNEICIEGIKYAYLNLNLSKFKLNLN